MNYTLTSFVFIMKKLFDVLSTERFLSQHHYQVNMYILHWLGLGSSMVKPSPYHLKVGV